MMDPRISMVTSGVSDMAAAVKFYEEGLGFPRMESPPTVAFFTLNGSWLGLYNRDSIAEDANVSPEGSGFNNFALAHNMASKTWTGTCGKLLIIPSFGLDLSRLSHNL